MHRLRSERALLPDAYRLFLLRPQALTGVYGLVTQTNVYTALWFWIISEKLSLGLPLDGLAPGLQPPPQVACHKQAI